MTTLRNAKIGFDPQMPAGLHSLVAAKVEQFKGLWLINRDKSVVEALWTPLRKRKLLVEDTLYKAAEKRGHRLHHEKRNIDEVDLLISGERINYWVCESVKRWKVALTKAELRRAAKEGDTRRRWKTVEEHTGTLAMGARGIYRGIGKGGWSDEPDRPLESQIDIILAGLEAIAAEAGAVRARDMEEERKARMRKAERERSRYVEESRWESACEMADALKRAQHMRTLIDTLAHRMPLKPHQARKLVKWLRWARAKVDFIDPLAQDMDCILARLGMDGS
jgi:hypothetical protein